MNASFSSDDAAVVDSCYIETPCGKGFKGVTNAYLVRRFPTLSTWHIHLRPLDETIGRTYLKSASIRASWPLKPPVTIGFSTDPVWKVSWSSSGGRSTWKQTITSRNPPNFLVREFYIWMLQLRLKDSNDFRIVDLFLLKEGSKKQPECALDRFRKTKLQFSNPWDSNHH